MNKKIQKNRGITLIALVITIIVLIILAGVAINLAFGQNGLVARAKTARGEYSTAEAKEKLEQEILNVQIQAVQEGKEFNLKYLKEKIDKTKYEITLDDEENPTTAVIKEIDSNYYLTVDSKLKVTKVEEQQPKTQYVKFSELTWTSGKASVELSTKETGTIEYKVGKDGIYQAGTTISNLSNGDIVYARINNNGTYTDEETLEIKDTIEPEEFTITASDITYEGVKLTGSTQDLQTGIKDYTYVTETKTNEIVKEIANQTVTEYTITGLDAETEYVVYMLAYDNAGNTRKSNEVTVKTAENIVYLYKDGVGSELVNLPSAFTGGTSLTKKTNYLVGAYNDSQTNNSSVSAFYIDNIDVENINHIYVHFYDVSMSGSSTIYASLCTAFNSQYNFPTNCKLIDKVTGTTVNNGEYLLDLDVSQMSGTFKMFFGGATVNDYSYNYYDPDMGTVEFKIDKIYYK